MAILGLDGFDLPDTIFDYWVSVGLGAVVSGAGRCGSPAWHGTAADGSGPSIGVAATTPSGYAGYAYNPDSFNTTPILTVFNSASQGVCFLTAGSDGRVTGWGGINTILGRPVCSTPPNVLHLGLYTSIGMEWLVSPAGYLRLYINGHLAADSGTVDMTAFNNFGNNQWTGISFTPEGYIDDCYWGDTSTADPLNPWAAFLGDLRVEGQLPLTDAIGGGGTFRQWTPSAGTDHGALLRDAPADDDLTYVASGLVGQKESVRFPPVTPTTGVIYAVQYLPSLVKTTFADRTVQVGTLVGASESYQAVQAPAQTNYRYYPAVYGGNPVALAPWTIATVNGAQALVKIAG